jgi:hypothetical protein
VPQSPITPAEFMAKAFQILGGAEQLVPEDRQAGSSGLPLISSSENPQNNL